MKRTLRLWLPLLALACTACPSNAPQLDPSTEEPELVATEFLSSVHVADPLATLQLLSGFHGLEQGSWRWTEKTFAVALKPPPPLPDEPVRLELRFSIPQNSIDRLGALTLSATVSSTPVGSETFAKPGDYVFSKPVPAEALDGEVVKVVFELDKALLPGDTDTRELGVVATSVALK